MSCAALPDPQDDRRSEEGRGANRQATWNRTWDNYHALVEQIEDAAEAASVDNLILERGGANSPLAMLLAQLRDAWEKLSGSDDVVIDTWSALPLAVAIVLSWIDPAGYTVAHSEMPYNWSDQASRHQFELSIDTRLVSCGA